MKFIAVRDFRSKPGQVWKDMETNDEMILTSNGKPIALLTPLSDATMETTLRSMRRAKAIAAVNTMQKRSMLIGNDTMTLSDINREIRAARQGRNRC